MLCYNVKYRSNVHASDCALVVFVSDYSEKRMLQTFSKCQSGNV